MSSEINKAAHEWNRLKKRLGHSDSDFCKEVMTMGAIMAAGITEAQNASELNFEVETEDTVITINYKVVAKNERRTIQ